MAHSYTNLLYHIVYGTRERQRIIDEAFQPRLYDYLGGTIRGLRGICLEIGGVEDHLHILVKASTDDRDFEFPGEAQSQFVEVGEVREARLWLAGRVRGLYCERITGGPR